MFFDSRAHCVRQQLPSQAQSQIGNFVLHRSPDCCCHASQIRVGIVVTDVLRPTHRNQCIVLRRVRNRSLFYLDHIARDIVFLHDLTQVPRRIIPHKLESQHSLHASISFRSGLRQAS